MAGGGDMRLLRRLFIPGLAAAIAMPLIPSQTVAASFSGPTAYVVNNGSNSVTPIATATNTAGTPITVGSAPDAIAITPNGATAYVVNNGSNSVTPIAP